MPELLLVVSPWHANVLASFDAGNGKPSTRVENGPPLG